MAIIPTKRENGSRRVQFNCVGPSKTKQACKDECDIKNIMSKFGS